MGQFRFAATIIEWRGPSPFFFAPVPPDIGDQIRQAARLVSYGWGVIPVAATIGDTVFTTSLFPKDGSYLLPLKDKVRRACAITAGDRVAVGMDLQFDRRR